MKLLTTMMKFANLKNIFELKREKKRITERKNEMVTFIGKTKAGFIG